MAVSGFDSVSNSVHQMSLSQTDTTVYEQRVVSFRWSFGHGKRRSMRKLVAGTDDKRFKGILLIQSDLCRLYIDLLGRVGRAVADRPVFGFLNFDLTFSHDHFGHCSLSCGFVNQELEFLISKTLLYQGFFENARVIPANPVDKELVWHF